MKKLHNFILCLLLLAINIFSSCKKETMAPPPPVPNTSLQVQVQTVSGTPVANASVILYANFSDFDSKKNALLTAATNSNGQVNFNFLNSQKYYFYAADGCFTNGLNSVSTAGEITANSINKAVAIIEPTGALVINNNSAYKYDIYINGFFAIQLPGGYSKLYQYKETGFYSIRVVKNDIGLPNDITYTGNLTCGGTLITNFP